MRNFEHINHEIRKIISSGLTKNKKAKEIADDPCIDISTVSKEIKKTEYYLKKLI